MCAQDSKRKCRRYKLKCRSLLSSEEDQVTVSKEITYLSGEVIKKKEERPSDSLLNKDITTTEDTKKKQLTEERCLH